MGIDADGNPLQPSTKGQRPIFEIELLFEENALCFSPSEDEYIDDEKGGMLGLEAARRARALEIEWLVQRKVIGLVDASELTGKVPDAKWADTRKSDGAMRSRLCAREIKRAM